ncbi:MAG: hypothetical protein JWM14_11 [Chitinophagaceae bacterium]|nr:hypothetical protein [Chitinophagaceae bacterium]
MKKVFSHPALGILLALLFYTFVFIIYTYPLVNVFSTHVSGYEGGDSAQYLWNIFIFRDNLVHQQPLFYTNYICYPLGTDLLLHTYTPIVNVFALLFKNPYVAVNVMTYLQFVLSGIGAYLLSKKLTQHITWSLFTGFMFAFGSYKMANYATHLNLILTAPIPFYILCFINTFRFSETSRLPVLYSIPYLLLSIVLLICSFFSDYYITYYILLFSGLYLCFPYLQQWFYSLSVKIRWITVVVFFLLSHIIINQLMLFNVDCNSVFWWQPDFLSFFIPSFFSNFFNTRSYYTLYSGPGAKAEVVIFMGWFFSLLVFYNIFLFFKHKKKALLPKHPQFEFYVFASLVFVMMTTPEAKLFDEGYFYLPSGFVHFIPFINNIRIPGRCVLMVSLFLPMVVAFLWIHYKSILPKSLYTVIPFLCLAVSFFEFLPMPYAMLNRSKQQPVNEWLQQKPGKVMMTLPLFVLDGMKVVGVPQKEQLMDQMVHQKKILGGYVSRLKEDVFSQYESDSLCRCIFYLEAHPEASLHALDKKYVTIFLNRFNLDLIHIPAVYEKSNVHLFIKNNFAPYILFKDSLNGDTVYGIHHL